ncbi:MAG TPA: hypothetical protein VK737_12095 [Opitutales bacterium]|nr:hypothetical protein [Opitutales bacterium]
METKQYLAAKVLSVEYILKTGGTEIIGLVLDVPDVKVRETWKALCQSGNIIEIDDLGATGIE